MRLLEYSLHTYVRSKHAITVKPKYKVWSRMSIHDYRALSYVQSSMVNTCVVPGCGNRSDRDHHLSFHALPLTNKGLLKQWLHQIGRKNVPLNRNSRVCSKHFKKSHWRKLQLDEYPTENLPQLATQVSTSTPRRPLVRRLFTENKGDDDDGESIQQLPTQDVGVNTDGDQEAEKSELEVKVGELEREIEMLKGSGSGEMKFFGVNCW